MPTQNDGLEWWLENRREELSALSLPDIERLRRQVERDREMETGELDVREEGYYNTEPCSVLGCSSVAETECAECGKPFCEEHEFQHNCSKEE